MPKHQTCITSEMQTKDNCYLFLNENVLCVWNKCSGEKIPRNTTMKKPNKVSTIDIMKGINEAFEEETRGQEGSQVVMSNVPKLQEFRLSVMSCQKTYNDQGKRLPSQGLPNANYKKE
eukprot:4072541-Ditylum_brightwellii.AAC.1